MFLLPLQVCLVVFRKQTFFVRVVQILFYDVHRTEAKYTMFVFTSSFNYNDLVQKVTLKFLNNTLLVDLNIVTTLLMEQIAARI